MDPWSCLDDLSSAEESLIGRCFQNELFVLIADFLLDNGDRFSG